MTQWNEHRCGGEPLGGKRSGACCCSYCEGYADALESTEIENLRIERDAALAELANREDENA
jgi:hypothetical protein